LQIIVLPTIKNKEISIYMKATGIVRRIDDLGRVVIPKETRRTLRIREGYPFRITLTQLDRFCLGVHSISKRIKAERNLRFLILQT
jgi:AbrB family looped-hinge helix DNA binding protein